MSTDQQYYRKHCHQMLLIKTLDGMTFASGFFLGLKTTSINLTQTAIVAAISEPLGISKKILV